jgi:phosphatidate cytidylyltransferase
MLKQRIVTALMIGLPLLGVLFFLPPMLTTCLFALVVLLAAWEWLSLLRWSLPWQRWGYLLMMSIAMALAWRYLRGPEYLPLLLQVALLWWLLALVWIMFFPQQQSVWLTAMAGLLTLVPAWIAINGLLQLSPSWLLLMLLMVVSTDIGGFLFGRRFGHTKLAVRVSPGKTWEGVLGGVLLAMLVAVLGAYRLAQPLPAFLGLCLLTVMISIVGDLSESLFKRHAGLKDSGNILPGHGGILDRIDSITAAAPLFLYGLIRLGVFVA